MRTFERANDVAHHVAGSAVRNPEAHLAADVIKLDDLGRDACEPKEERGKNPGSILAVPAVDEHAAVRSCCDRG